MMSTTHIRVLTAALLTAAALAGLGGCSSSIQPMKPLQHITEEVATAPATTPATMLATASAPATGPATEPATLAATSTTAPATHPAKVTRVVDPNQTMRLAYRANYDHLWQQSLKTLTDLGYRLDRQDYRLGVITTKPNFGSHLVEPWKPDQTSVKSALENTMHTQRRSIRLTIAPARNPAYYEVAVQVLVERETNPSGEVGGVAFTEGSGFGRTAAALRSDAPQAGAPQWYPVGHDVELEKKVLSRLFKKL